MYTYICIYGTINRGVGRRRRFSLERRAVDANRFGNGPFHLGGVIPTSVRVLKRSFPLRRRRAFTIIRQQPRSLFIYVYLLPCCRRVNDITVDRRWYRDETFRLPTERSVTIRAVITEFSPVVAPVFGTRNSLSVDEVAGTRHPRASGVFN